MLPLGMDGPNANLQSQKLFLGSDKLAAAQTCLLYILHNAFRKVVKFCKIQCRSICIGYSSYLLHQNVYICYKVVGECASKHPTTN